MHKSSENSVPLNPIWPFIYSLITFFEYVAHTCLSKEVYLMCAIIAAGIWFSFSKG